MRVWLGLAVVALTFVGSLDNAFVDWDDHVYIHLNTLVTAPTEHSRVEHLTTPALGYPMPLPVLLYRGMWGLGHGAAWPFHAFSLAIHLVNVFVLHHLLRRLGAAPWPAFGGMLAFGCHPIVVEPVAWSSGLKDLLVAAGTLLAITALLHRRTSFLPASLAWASKPTSVALGPTLLVFTWFLPPTGASRRRWVEPIAITALGVLVAAFAWLQEDPTLRTTADTDGRAHRVLAAFGLVLEHLVAPARLAPMTFAGDATPVHLLCAAAGLAAACLAVWHWAKQRDVRGAWLMLSILTYAPVSNLVPLARFSADSYVYLPWAGVVAVVTLSWAPCLAYLAGKQARAARVVGVLPCVVLPAWMGLTVVRVEVWSDTLSLWGDAWESRSYEPEFIYRYGDALGRAGRAEEEISLYLDRLEELGSSPRLPAGLPLYFDRSGAPQQALHWYRMAFARPLGQGERMYANYVGFVARHPELHPRELDGALRYAAATAKPGSFAAMSAAERSNLTRVLGRIGLPSQGWDHVRALGLAPPGR